MSSRSTYKQDSGPIVIELHFSSFFSRPAFSKKEKLFLKLRAHVMICAFFLLLWSFLLSPVGWRGRAATGGILWIWQWFGGAIRWGWSFLLSSCWFMFRNLAIDARNFFLFTLSFILTTGKSLSKDMTLYCHLVLLLCSLWFSVALLALDVSSREWNAEEELGSGNMSIYERVGKIQYLIEV